MIGADDARADAWFAAELALLRNRRVMQAEAVAHAAKRRYHARMEEIREALEELGADTAEVLEALGDGGVGEVAVERYDLECFRDLYRDGRRAEAAERLYRVVRDALGYAV